MLDEDEDEWIIVTRRKPKKKNKLRYHPSVIEQDKGRRKILNLQWIRRNQDQTRSKY